MRVHIVYAVSVVIPVRNESRYIERCLSAVMNQDCPSRLVEVLIVDGMSEDGTRDMIRSKLRAFRDGKFQSPSIGSQIVGKVKVLDNPLRATPTALNIALQHASGDVVVRVDGHCRIPPDYVSRCVKVLQETGADCVGGLVEAVGETWTAQGIALAQNSVFGVGGVAFRTGRRRPGYVDTVAFGAYRRQVFDHVGRFDEEFLCNEDDEFNFRLIQAGGKIWLDPSIRSIYYSRAGLHSLWYQYFRYGFYKVLLIHKRRGVPSWRHLVPGAFVLALLGSLILTIFTRQAFWTLGITGPYLVASALASLWAVRSDPRTLPVLPLAFATMHLAYGLGFLVGLWRWMRSRPNLLGATG